MGLAATSAARAGDGDKGPPTGQPEASIATSLPNAFRNPGAVRSILAARGITGGANYIGEIFATSSGGAERRGYYDGRLELYADIDFSMSTNWKGLKFHVNAYQIHGESITGQSVGSMMPVSYIEATPSTRLFELYFEQELIKDTLNVRFGQLAADCEFLLSKGGGSFINGTWGWPSIAAADLPNGGPAYPLATPGVRVQVKPTEQFGLMVGLYNGDPVGSCPGDEDPQKCNDHSLEFRLKEPPLLMVEGSYDYNTSSLPGTIKMGAWQHFGDFEKFATGKITDNDHAFYAIIDQLIYRVPGEGEDAKGIGLFARVIGAPDDRNLAEIYAEAGITVSGMISRRPDDVLAIGYAYTKLSNDAPDLLGHRESLLEISYTAQIATGWTIQPDFQYIWNPSGGYLDEDDKVVDHAAVVGVRTLIDY